MGSMTWDNRTLNLLILLSYSSLHFTLTKNMHPSLWEASSSQVGFYLSFIVIIIVVVAIIVAIIKVRDCRLAGELKN